MTSFKILTLALISLMTQLAFAQNWKHQELNKDGYTVKISYTRTTLAATYGSNGGAVANEFYVDLFSSRPAFAQSADILDAAGSTLSRLPFHEDTQSHFWAVKSQGPSYADFLYVNQTYALKILVDGREIIFKFKL